MTDFEFGDVVLVRFPFTDQSTSKQRPAVVISSDAYHRTSSDLLIMAITSRGRRRAGAKEAAIRGWREAGLLKPSAFKPLVATVEAPLVRRRLGRLQSDDLQVLREILDTIIGGQ